MMVVLLALTADYARYPDPQGERLHQSIKAFDIAQIWLLLASFTHVSGKIFISVTLLITRKVNRGFFNEFSFNLPQISSLSSART